MCQNILVWGVCSWTVKASAVSIPSWVYCHTNAKISVGVIPRNEHNQTRSLASRLDTGEYMGDRRPAPENFVSFPVFVSPQFASLIQVGPESSRVLLRTCQYFLEYIVGMICAPELVRQSMPPTAFILFLLYIRP